MSNDPVESGEGADDLLGRWLAHHDKPGEDEATPPPRQIPTAARPSAAAVPQTRLSASAVLAELRGEAVVDKRDGLGAVAAPSDFGVRRGQPGSADSGPTGAPTPVGFEPVILRSVRKKSEPKEEPEKDKRGRLSRLRSRVAGPPEDAEVPGDPAIEVPVVSLYDEPVAYVPPPVFKTPPPAAAAPAAPAEAPRPIVPYVDMVALATAASLPVTEPEVEPVVPEPEPVVPEPAPEPEPVVPEPAPEPVVPEPAPEPAVPEPEPTTQPEPTTEPMLPGASTPPSPLSVLPEQQDDGEEPDVPTTAAAEAAPDLEEAPTKRRLVTRTKRPVTDVTEERKHRRSLVARSASTGTGTAGAARGLLAAARAATPPPAAPAPARPAPATVAKVPMLPVEKPVDAAPPAPAMEMPAVYEFAPLKSSRRFLSLMLIAGLILSGYLGYAAYQSRATITIGLAGIVTLATMVIWAIRAGATVTRLTVRSGQLEIKRQGGRMVFDLASTYTGIEVTGKPRSKKWKVQFVRPGMPPVVVDATMVDGREFMKILSFYRPDLAPS